MDYRQLSDRIPKLSECRDDIEKCIGMLLSCFRGGGRLFVCGNGGSAADCAHIVGELAKGFLKKRPVGGSFARRLAEEGEEGRELSEKLQGGLPVHDLCENVSLNTAVANDIGADMIFAQQICAYGRAGDILLVISTSGCARNGLLAAAAARAMGLSVIGLTGSGGGKLKPRCDVCIAVPEKETYLVQELHLPVYHYICASVEEALFE